MANKGNKASTGSIATAMAAAPVATPKGWNGIEAGVEAPVAAAPLAIGNHTLHYRRAHPGGGVLGRCSYGVPGVAGIVVFDVALFLPGAPPATITLNVALATPTPRGVAHVTSAVVANRNLEVAKAEGKAIATPATVAAVAAPAGVAALASK